MAAGHGTLKVYIPLVNGMALYSLLLDHSCDFSFEGVVFASVEFAASSKKPALFVQLIPKGADLTCSADYYYPVSFLPPRCCPGVYRSTYGKLCPNPSALLPVLLHSHLAG